MTQRPGPETAYAELVERMREDTAGGVSPAQLDEVREHVLNDRLHAPHRSIARRLGWPLGLAGALAAAAVALMVWVPRGSTPIRVATWPVEIVALGGDVRVQGARGEDLVPSALAGQTELHVVVGDEGSAQMSVGAHARLALTGPARLDASKTNGAHLVDGAAAVSVHALPKRGSFEMRAGDALIVVHGTEFTLHVATGRLQHAAVLRGAVEIRWPHSERTVHLLAGQSWGQIAVEPASPEAVPEEARVALPAESAPRAQHSTARRAHDVVNATLWQQAQQLLQRRECARLTDVVRRLRAGLTDGNDHARALMLLAECELRGKRAAAALELYEQVLRAYPETRVAEVATFQSARVLADLGRREQAQTRLRDYLTRFADGQFVTDAELRLCELAIDAAALAEGRACLERFRRKHPSSVRDADVLLLLATLARVQARWVDAVELYTAYLATHPQVERADEALYQKIVCLQRGRLPGLKDAAREYLTSHGNGKHAAEVQQLAQ